MRGGYDSCKEFGTCPAGNGRTNTGVANPANWYDGFSSFKKLTNNEPPLAMRYSTPIKCKLTPEVFSCSVSKSYWQR